MCKVLMISGITNETNANAVKFMKAMAPLMSSGNTDGLGYSAANTEGNLFGERWHKNDDAFVLKKLIEVSNDKKDASLSLLSKVSKKPTHGYNYYNTAKPSNYNSYGEVDLTTMVALTMHTRMATSGKEFANTHPFYDPDADVSLIHNGIIRNDNEFDLKLSTCDSEAILVSYVNNKVNMEPESIQVMSNELVGYYACGILAKDSTNNRVLDIFKGNGASLHVTWVDQLNTLVYSTSSADIKTACEKLGFTHTEVMEVNEGNLIRHNAFTGEAIHIETFVAGRELLHTPKTNVRTVEPATTNNTTKNCMVTRLPETNNVASSTMRKAQTELIDYLKLKPTTIDYSVLELIVFTASHYLYGETGVAV